MPETVNGPEDVPEWDLISWVVHEENVARLRQRIFTAVRDGDWPKARNLQKLMLRSWSSTLVSVRQVTQRNAGRRTAGIDGVVVLDSAARMVMAREVHRTITSWEPMPVRRVYIPKANGKQRPLGIPVIMDRAHQARVKNALEPEWEARFEPRSYGFRPGRCCQDAGGSLFWTLKGKSGRAWILDADLTAAFDKISHPFLLSQLGSFPARDMIAKWLKAGVFEAGKGFAPTEEGTPQGGVITPPTQKVISASRLRWVTGGWSVAGERRGAGGAAGVGSGRVRAAGGTGRDPGGRAGRRRTRGLGPAGRRVADRAGHLDAADGRVVDRAVAGSGAGPVRMIIRQAGDFRLSSDVICSIFMSCLGIAARVPRSTRSMSTRPPGCWKPGLRLLRRPACWPGGWAARNARPAVTSARPRHRAGSWSRRRPRCSLSGFPSGWPPRCGSTPARLAARSRRSPRRRWRSSWAAVTGTAGPGERAAGGDGARFLPPCRRRNVGGLRHFGAAAAGQDRRRPGGGRRRA